MEVSKRHIPVLKKEVLRYLDPKPNENFIDCTIGQGGHSQAILEKNGPEGKVLGIEIDLQLYEEVKAKCVKWSFKQRMVLVNDSYINLKKIVRKEKPSDVKILVGNNSRLKALGWKPRYQVSKIISDTLK